MPKVALQENCNDRFEFSPYFYSMQVFLIEHVEYMVQLTNIQLALKGLKATSHREILNFLGSFC